MKNNKESGRACGRDVPNLSYVEPARKGNLKMRFVLKSNTDIPVCGFKFTLMNFKVASSLRHPWRKRRIRFLRSEIANYLKLRPLAA